MKREKGKRKGEVGKHHDPMGENVQLREDRKGKREREKGKGRGKWGREDGGLSWNRRRLRIPECHSRICM